LLNIGALMIFWETVQNTVISAAVSADVRDELLRAADTTPIQLVNSLGLG